MSLKEDIVEALKDDSGSKAIVFAGRVVSIRQVSEDSEPPGQNYIMNEVSFIMAKLWKGSPQRFISVRTWPNEASCGYPFKVGKNYLVYARHWKSQNHTNYCSPTKQLAQAKEDLVLLGPPIYTFNFLPLLMAIICSTMAMGAFCWRRYRRHNGHKT
ncbi:MAG TPA: hypothetical protein VGB77_10385 [Abditibacteriaceae bacterium]|jgi:hypothetical protein